MQPHFEAAANFDEWPPNEHGKPTQAAVMKAAADAEARGWKTSEEKTSWYTDQLKKNGMNVAPPTAQLKSDFQKIGATMTEEWLKTAGADGKAIVDAYRK